MVVSFLQFVSLLLDENFLNSQVSGYVYSASRTIRHSLASVLTVSSLMKVTARKKCWKERENWHQLAAEPRTTYA